MRPILRNASNAKRASLVEHGKDSNAASSRNLVRTRYAAVAVMSAVSTTSGIRKGITVRAHAPKKGCPASTFT